MSVSPRRRVLFYRKYDQYSGGQQKVFDYFTHFLQHEGWEPSIYWHPESVDVSDTIWAEHHHLVVSSPNPDACDLLFLAGMDWQFVVSYQRLLPPVINLIQHVRHADPSADVFPFLVNEALRICVAPEVKSAIDATGRVVGETVVIENGIELSKFQALGDCGPPCDFYILGNKQPDLAHKLASRLSNRGYSVRSHLDHEAQHHVWQAMSSAGVAIVLPHETEGFYLPALEAMALSKVVVVPDCVGNRAFCRHGYNCIMPALDLAALETAALDASDALDSAKGLYLQKNAKKTLEHFTLQREREAFHQLLASLEI